MAEIRKNLAVGHFYNAPFRETCARFLPRIAEVFFAWPGVLSCRPAPEFTPEVRERLFGDLRWARARGIRLDTLFNANCYGDAAISTELADFVEKTLREMDSEGLFPDVVTTTSPFVARVLRVRFPSVRIRASVNMRIHGTVGFDYASDLFDEFYLSRERQRDLSYARRAAEWARERGKTVGMQVNSGCLRECPFQTFHDNLHGHGDGRRPSDAAAAKKFDFSFFRCKTHYAAGGGALVDFLRSTWVRPEDVPLWEDAGISLFKVAIRRHPRPVETLRAYAEYSFDGNLVSLMDPDHSAAFAPLVLDNKRFPADWAVSGVGAACAGDCRGCGRCEEIFRRVAVRAADAR
ncbi:MAG: hypothetical protein IJ678_01020 [Kiritimatiellae bacterium]|nr:hypothetical protein [Kiritimatiellia bacterium]